MSEAEFRRSEAPIVVIAGPTATGKTAVGSRVARLLDGEIISADSMAVYRGMDVGTAKPNAGERKEARFYLIDVADPGEQFNAARFKNLAEEALKSIRHAGKTPLMVGGTGLYIRAFLEGFSLTDSPPDEELRSRLDADATELGVNAMHERLRQIDPDAAAKIHPNDRVRILRALEVCERTGRPISVQHREDALNRFRHPAHNFVLTASREELNRRIDLRVDKMIQNGLEKEVRALMLRGYDRRLSSMRSLGYKEMTAFIEGECTLDAAVSEIKKNTRRFAKRQLTWFRAEKDYIWIDVCDRSSDDIAAEIRDHLR